MGVRLARPGSRHSRRPHATQQSPQDLYRLALAGAEACEGRKSELRPSQREHRGFCLEPAMPAHRRALSFSGFCSARRSR